MTEAQIISSFSAKLSLHLHKAAGIHPLFMWTVVTDSTVSTIYTVSYKSNHIAVLSYLTVFSFASFKLFL